MSKMFAEEYRVEKGFLGDAAGGVSTDRLKVSKGNRVAVLLKVETGVATTLSVKIQEHDAAVAGNTQDVVRTVPVHYKTDAASVMTRLDENGLADIAIADLDTAAGLVVVEIEKDDLTNGFEYVSLAIAAPGAARQVCALYALDSKFDPAYQLEL